MKNFWQNLPNIITAVRIVGSPGLIVLAFTEHTWWLAGLVVFLVFTEWADGFLARRLKASSPLGARLDTVADAVFYSSLLISILLLRPSIVGQQRVWIIIAVASYALSWLASWIKFRHLPSYHTYAAKAVWIVVGLGIICLLTDISPWPFRIAMLCVSIANLEAIGITCLLNESQVDVPTIWHARGKRRAKIDSAPDNRKPE